jgi:hypothetical protein
MESKAAAEPQDPVAPVAEPVQAQTTPGNPDATSVEAAPVQAQVASDPVVEASEQVAAQAQTPGNPATTSVEAAPEQVVAPQVVAPQVVAPQVVAQAQTTPGNPDATSVEAAQPVVAEPVQAAAAPAAQVAQDAVPVDANYSAILGAFVHELAELYQIKDNAKIKIGSDKVTAANFTATLEVNDSKLTITLTPVDGSAGPAALEAIKLKIAAPKPVEVSPVEATTGPASAAEVQVDASAVPKPAVEATTGPATTAEVQVDASAVKPGEAVAKSEGGYRRRKRNLRTIKKQQQRNRRTMNKH